MKTKNNKNDEILFSIAQTAKKLGGISRNTVMQEIHDGKLKACMRGKRKYCSQEQINEYKASQLIDNSVSTVKYIPKYLGFSKIRQ